MGLMHLLSSVRRNVTLFAFIRKAPNPVEIAAAASDSRGIFERWACDAAPRRCVLWYTQYTHDHESGRIKVSCLRHLHVVAASNSADLRLLAFHISEKWQGMILEAVTSNCVSILDANGNVQTEPFLSTCGHVLPFIDQLGTGLMIVRADVSGNIERLRSKWQSDQQAYTIVTEIALVEKQKGEHKGSKSCAKGLLWLTRGMQFIVQLLKHTADDPSMQLSAAVRQAYAEVLQPYHGMISSSAFAIAMAFVPSRETLFQRMGDSEAAVQPHIDLFVQKFGGILKILEDWLDQNGLNDPEKV